METLIEPHRLIACMFCVVSASRPMLSARKYYPEGPNHILPLLQLALPGIDPNDFKKTLVSAVTHLRRVHRFSFFFCLYITLKVYGWGGGGNY